MVGFPTSNITFSGDYDALVASGQLEIIRAGMYNCLVFVYLIPISSDLTLSKGLFILDIQILFI